MDIFKTNSLVSKLKRAIHRNTLSLNFFPVIDVQTNTTVEAEVLVRWCVKNDIHIPPVEFIRIAEANGLMPTLSNWIISTAIYQLHLWRQQEYELGITINLSPKEIENENLVAFVEAQLSKYDIPPEKLGFEIAERNILMLDDEQKLTLARLHALGVRLILDNASGLFLNTSLDLENYWQTIKIDWLLVLQSANNFQVRSLVKKLIANAFKQSEFVVIPGVHTHEEWQSINKKNNVLAQGYYFTSPKNRHDLDLWFRLSHWKPRSILQAAGNAL